MMLTRPEDLCLAEFYEWERELPYCEWRLRHTFPDPTDPGGLPDGWEPVSRLDALAGRVFLHLVRRTAGGWLVVVHQPKTALTQMVSQAPTLAGVYADAHWNVNTWALPFSPQHVIDWLTEYLLTLFDPTDPAEAAERTLVGLGARMGRLPRAAY